MKSGLAKNKETCETCGTEVEVLSEFNRQQVCAHCFEQLIRIKVGGRGGTIFVKEIPDTRRSALQGDVLLAS